MSKITLLELSISSTPEEQQIPIRILDFKSTLTIIITVFEWQKKLDIPGREFCRECIWIWNMKVGVPAGNTFFDISWVIRHWIDTNILQHDHRRTSLYDAEKNIVLTRSLKRDVDPETFAIKRQGYGNIPLR